MKLYITAPMTNVPCYNHVAIDAAAEFVKHAGHEPVSPAEHEREVIPHIADTPGYATGARLDETHRLPLLTWDLHQVLDCDGIVVLPGKGGRGMRIESDVARATDKRIFHLVTAGSGIGRPWIEGAELRLVEPPKPVVVGLAGYGQVGKSLAGLTLGALGFVEIGTADAIRAALYVLNPSIKVKNHWTKLRTHVDLVGWEKAKALPGIRALMQRMGTEVADIVDEEMWCGVIRRRIENAYFGRDETPAEPARVVVTSVRRLGDARSIIRMGGEVWRIEREGYGPINDHPNETELDDWSYDFTIWNPGQSIERYTNLVAEVALLRGLLSVEHTRRLSELFGTDTALAEAAS